jgi:hypothetical protein
MFDHSVRILGLCVVCLLLIYLFQSFRSAARRSARIRVVQYGRSMRILAVGSLMFVAFFLPTAAQAPPRQQWLAWALAALLCGAAAYVALEALLVHLEFDEERLYAFSPWRGSRTIPWAEVVSIRFSPLNRGYVVRTRSQGSVRVSLFMSGLDAFLARVDRELRRQSGAD